MHRFSFVLFAMLMCCLYLAPLSPVQAQAQPSAPLTPHCRRAGPAPLDPDYCGCTWGAVYYRGLPLGGAHVQLRFTTQVTETVTLLEPQTEPFPFYITSGATLGARRSDIMTVTTTLAGQTATRTFRALPDTVEREQEVALVLPEQGVWTPDWLSGGYTRTLVVQGNTLWAGGPAGLVAVDQATGSRTPQTLPWASPAVVALALAPTGHLWAAGPRNLAEWDGVAWQDRTVPFSASIRALAIDPATGALWVGGGDSSAALAVYNGNWQPVTAVGDFITALAVQAPLGAATQLWVGTWGGGVYRHTAAATDLTTGWTRYRIGDGLASDYVYSIATTDDAVWFGTRPYDQNQRHLGGVGQYQLTTNSWRSYTTTHGLPADPSLSNNPGHIYAILVDSTGTPWASTAVGVYRLVMPNLWAPEVTFGTDVVRGLAGSAQFIFAGRAAGQVARLDRNATPGQPPTVQINATAPPTVSQTGLLQLTATATDQDGAASETNPQILAWDWQSDRAGPLCTTATTCAIEAALLAPGVHNISVRVQDDEGVWSQAATTPVTVTTPAAYIPFVRRQ